MEMTVTVHLPRRRPRPLELVVRWSGEHTAADLAAALADHLGEPVRTLRAGGMNVDPTAIVGMPPLVNGASLTVAGSGTPAPATAAGSVLDLAVVGGPDCGRSHPLTPPGLVVGRSVGRGLVVDDEALSRVHARVRVGPSGVIVEDAGSTNGVVVDGRPIEGATRLDGASTVVMGSSTLRLRRGGAPGLTLHAPGDGTLLLRLPAGQPSSAGFIEVECPQAPADAHRARIPWVAALVPIPVAVALAVLVGPQLLLFALVGPLVLLGNAATERWGAGRAHRRVVAEHGEALRAAQERLDRALAEEVARLDAGHPDPHAVLAAAEHRLASLWRGGNIGVRLGLGDVRTRVAWVDGSSRSHPLAQHAPVVVDLVDVGCLGVVGPPATTDRLLTNVVGQLCTRHPPDRLTVTVAGAGPSWEWTNRMPHSAPRLPPVATAGETTGRPLGVLVVPSAGADGVDGLIETARAAGVPVVVGATQRAALPESCTVIVEDTGGGRHTLTHAGGTTRLTLDLVGAWWAERLSRALAPLRPALEQHRAGPPEATTLCEVLGETRLTPEAVLRRWGRATRDGRSASEPVATVGLGTRGVHEIDLRRDGPHVLVGGTTGSGKSEFLRTLVTSLAVGSPPADLCLVLVDFKGGAAFGPCADLPHVVGVVTDLDDHLVARALTSLAAELRRREALFAAVGAADIDAYLRCRGPDDEQVPRLVLVVDELRALVDEVPEFVRGMVRLAALGRSLGVHLVLATQRPSGVVTPEIQANVNLRIAFRVRDRSDSLGILDDGAAASLPAGIPGRALASGGDGALEAFQAAIVAPAPRSPTRHLCVAPLGPALGDRRDHPGAGTAAPDDAAAADERLVEMAEVVRAVEEAHRLTGGTVPAPPWVPPLPKRVEPQVGAASAGDQSVAGLVDEPELQRVSPLLWTAAASGTWLLVGRPRSGRTTAARAVTLAAAATHDADRLHVHVLDTGGSLADLSALPQAGTHLGVDDIRAVRALVAHLREEVDRRRRMPQLTAVAPTASAAPRVLLVVDGWERLAEADSEGDAAGAADDMVRLLRDGAGVGVTGVVTGGRNLLQPSWSAVGGTLFLLGSADPLDAALAGLRPSDLPSSPAPGRAVRVTDRRCVQFAAATPSTSELVSATAVAGPRTGSSSGPFVLRPLPHVVRRSDTVGGPRPEVDAPGSHDRAALTELPVGVAGDSASTWAWVPDRMGRRLLVAGPPRSGRTNALRVLAQAALEAGLPVAAVTAKALEGRLFGRGVAVGPHDVEALVALRRARPDLVLLVDDADLLDDAPVLGAIREISSLVDRDGGLVVVTSSPTAVLGRFRGVDVDTARHRAGLLLTPRPGDADVFGLRRGGHGIPPYAGRGLACTPQGVTELQVFLAEDAPEAALASSVGGVGAPRPIRRVAHGQGGTRTDHADGDHRPPDQGLVPLDQPDTHGQQQEAPDDRGGARPGGTSDPSPAHHPQGDAGDEDENGRHQHAGGVAALPDRELVHVERREADERHRLEPDEHGGDATGAA